MPSRPKIFMASEPRCLLMGMPPAAVQLHLVAELQRLGLKQRLGNDLFAPSNWHQSLSDRFDDHPDVIDQLLRAGSLISARAVRLRIARVESRFGPDGVHWEFKFERTPADFAALLRNVDLAISSVTNRKQGGHSGHLTISYQAPEHLARMIAIQPVEWILDEVLLVRGGGAPYQYHGIEGGCWKLLQPRAEMLGEQIQLL